MGGKEKYLGKYSQLGIKYQDFGRGDERCSSCQNFLVEEVKRGEGCQVVADIRHGDGWCLCWRPILNGSSLKEVRNEDNHS